MCFKIILKVTKKQDFTLSIEDTFFEKPQEVVKLTPSPSRFRVNVGNKYKSRELEHQIQVNPYYQLALPLAYFSLNRL